MSFSGRKPGYVFKRDSEGLGYYRDVLAGDKNKSKEAEAEKEVNKSLDSQKLTTSGEVQTEKSATQFIPIDSKRDEKLLEFEFEYRQTKSSLALIVQVRGIVQSSVRVAYQSDERGLDVSFCASGGDTGLQKFGGGFSVLGQLSAQDCTYDVASENMVILLQKKESGFWTASRAPGVGGGQDLAGGVICKRNFVCAEISNFQEEKEAKEPSTGQALALALGGGADKGPDAIPVELLANMQFSDINGLLDLD